MVSSSPLDVWFLMVLPVFLSMLSGWLYTGKHNIEICLLFLYGFQVARGGSGVDQDMYLDTIDQGGTCCAVLQAGLWGFSNLWGFLRICVLSKGVNEASHRRWKGCPQSSILNLQSSILSPQSSVLSPQKCPKQCFCSQKLDLRHFSANVERISTCALWG